MECAEGHFDSDRVSHASLNIDLGEALLIRSGLGGRAQVASRHLLDGSSRHSPVLWTHNLRVVLILCPLRYWQLLVDIQL